MKNNWLPVYIIILFQALSISMLCARSIHRPLEFNIPELTSSWFHKPSISYTIRDSHIEEYPLFKIFDETHFRKHLLPSDEIHYRNNENQSVDSKVLITLRKTS